MILKHFISWKYNLLPKTSNIQAILSCPGVDSLPLTNCLCSARMLNFKEKGARTVLNSKLNQELSQKLWADSLLLVPRSVFAFPRNLMDVYSLYPIYSQTTLFCSHRACFVEAGTPHENPSQSPTTTSPDLSWSLRRLVKEYTCFFRPNYPVQSFLASAQNHLSFS